MTCLNKQDQGKCLECVFKHGVLSQMVRRMEDESIANCVRMFMSTNSCEGLDGFADFRD